MKEYKYFQQQIKFLNFDQKLVLALCATIFMPVYINILATFIFVIYLIVTKKITTVFQMEKVNYLFVALIISFCTSLFYGNMIGILCVNGMLLVLIVALYYRSIVDKNMFYLLIKVATFMSLVVAVIGLFQFFMIAKSHGFENILLIGNKPKDRVYSVFINANYYATIIEFVILMAIYKLTVVKDRYSSSIYYILIIVVNVMMLYLTGGRTVWVAILSAIPFMFLFKQRLKLGVTLIILEFLCLLFLLLSGQFPRIDTVGKDFLIRVDIWETVIQIFRDHPLFGMGPLTYRFAFLEYGGPKTVHAHSLYLDPLINFGLVTVSIVGVYFWNYGKLYLSSSHKKSYSFIGGIVVATAIHGLFDITILNFQTGMLFLIIINSIGLRELPKEIERK